MTLIGHIVGTKGNTGRGIASIAENADYTITINLTDGTSYTTAPIAGFTKVEFDENYDLVVTKTDGTQETVETDLGDYETLLAGYKSDAETAESHASGYATAASGSANTASAQATLARSYAKGDTSSRTGETTDNADYYRGLAANSATSASGFADSASASASTSGTQALKSEGFALGEQNGSTVTSGSPYYHNNSKYFSQLSSASSTNASTSATNANTDALKAEGYAVGKQNGTSVSSDSPYYHHNAMYYNSQATNMASLATNKANSAGTDALKAEGFSVGEQNGTPVTSDSDYYENNAKYYAEQAETSAQSLVIEDALDEDSTNAVENGVITKEFAKKANVDGYYDTLGAGTAEQLTSNIYEEDSEPYNFRTSGGSIDIGDRETDMLVGGTVAWNQLYTVSGNTATVNGVTITLNGDRTWTLNGTCTENGSKQISQPLPIVLNHVYLIMGMIDGHSGASSNNSYLSLSGIKGDTGNGWVWKNTQYTSNVYLRFDLRVNGSWNNAVVKPQWFDLTAMFGSTIADYIYSLEQANAGAGVAWFKKLFPKPYYAYNAGELMSVNASSHDMVGFNAWDEEWELGKIFESNGGNGSANDIIRSKNYIPILPNTTYYVKGSAKTFYYDADKNYLGFQNSRTDTTFVTLENAHFMRFLCSGTTYNNDICINLSWDGERDGEYEEYVKHSYALDDITLRGIPKLDANNNLYYDGDEYESDGTVTRRYGIVDLSSKTWTYQSSWGSWYTDYISDMRGTDTGAETPKFICDKYDTIATNYGLTPQDFNGITSTTKGGSGCRILVKNGSTTTPPTGTLVYELATPTTETADPYTNPQIVDDFGTEEYVDGLYSAGTRDVSIPVGHYTEYMANLKAKLEMSPNSPEGSGDYIVRQTNGENEYVTLASNATIQDIIARLEALEGGGE